MPIIVSALLSALALSSIENALTALVSTGKENSILLLVLALALLSIGILGPLFVLMITLFYIQKNLQSTHQSMISFWTENFSPLLIESIRVFGKSLSWALLGIIPGFIKYIQWALTPFVVVFDQRYPKGDVDALQQSRGVLKNLWWKTALLIMTPYILEFLFSLLSQNGKVSLLENPFASFFTITLITLVQVFIYIYLSLLITNRQESSSVGFSR